jgi:hypothetical protein
MPKKLAIIFLMIFPIAGFSGELVRNTTILEVTNTFNNGPDFAIRIEGGTGVCSTTSWLIFPESKKQSADSYKQAFSIALAALTTGHKVRVHNFSNNLCSEANFISITK